MLVEMKQGTLSRSVHCNFVRDDIRLKGEGRAPFPPPTLPARADFSIMMRCTPEIDNRHSVCTLRCGQWFIDCHMCCRAG
jgi:hypothetical protein